MEYKELYGNFFVCENEVFVEGKSLGQFQSFESENTRESLVGEATVTLPFYTMAAKAAKTVNPDSVIAPKSVGKNVMTYVRINPQDWDIKTGAHIQVYAKYRDDNILGHKFENVRVFDGFIREVIGGFPTVIRCEDYGFVLRFGTVTKSWPQSVKLSDLLSDLCDISNTAFAEYRDKNNFDSDKTRALPQLTPSGKCEVTGISLKPAVSVSPYDILHDSIMSKYKLFAGVEELDKPYLWVGLAINEKDSPTARLDTSVNVIECSLVPQNMLFENFKVIVRFLDSGTLKTVEKGSKNGLPYEIPFIPNKTSKEMETIANSALNGLKANRNKGTITTLLYPVVNLFDYINFTHTIFSTLSGGYYVIGKSLKLDENGYKQVLTVTDKTFVYLSN